MYSALQGYIGVPSNVRGSIGMHWVSGFGRNVWGSWLGA